MVCRFVGTSFDVYISPDGQDGSEKKSNMTTKTRSLNFTMINFFLPVLVGLPSVLATSGGHCPPTGPVLPQPAIPSNIDLSKLNSQFERIVHNASESFNTTENSFSVLLTTKNGTLYQYHHSAPVRDPAGVKKVDGDSVYRVCSVTKVFNVLTLLLNAGKLLDAPVTAYVPELEGNKVYEDVTLRMLTSQISGVPRRGESSLLCSSEVFSLKGEYVI